MTEDRYDRQRRIEQWRQDALEASRVILFGAGALGNEVLKNLALIGVGHILLVDFDHIELSNLSRCVLFRESDLGKPKAKVAAKAARDLNPDIRINHINGNLFFDVGLGFYRHADLVISGLDNLAARSHVGICSALAGTPFLDGGMWALGGEARWFFPGDGPCFECTLTKEDRKRAFERRSCTGFKAEETGHFPMAATIGTTAVVAGLMTQEIARFLCGWETPENEAIVYNGFTRSMHVTEFTRDPDCPYHSAYENITELEKGADEITARELIAMGGGPSAVLELGRDYLAGFHCKACGAFERVEKLLGRVKEARSLCGKCGTVMAGEIISRVEKGDKYEGRKLCELGVPQGEVLGVRSGDSVRLFELKIGGSVF